MRQKKYYPAFTLFHTSTIGAGHVSHSVPVTQLPRLVVATHRPFQPVATCLPASGRRSPPHRPLSVGSRPGGLFRSATTVRWSQRNCPRKPRLLPLLLRQISMKLPEQLWREEGLRRRKRKMKMMRMRRSQVGRMSRKMPLAAEVCRLAVPRQLQVLLAPRRSLKHCPFSLLLVPPQN